MADNENGSAPEDVPEEESASKDDAVKEISRESDTGSVVEEDVPESVVEDVAESVVKDVAETEEGEEGEGMGKEEVEGELEEIIESLPEGHGEGEGGVLQEGAVPLEATVIAVEEVEKMVQGEGEGEVLHEGAIPLEGAVIAVEEVGKIIQEVLSGPAGLLDAVISAVEEVGDAVKIAVGEKKAPVRVREPFIPRGDEIPLAPSITSEDEEELERKVREATYPFEGECERDAKEIQILTEEERRRAEAEGMLKLSKSEEALAEEHKEDGKGRVTTTKMFVRHEYIDKYKFLCKEKFAANRKNSFLQRKLYDYCKKKKLEIYFQEIHVAEGELEKKYYQQLSVFEDFKRFEEKALNYIDRELGKLTTDRDRTQETLKVVIDELIEKERLVGTGLISSKTGKPLPEKALEKLLSRQQQKINEVFTVRLNFIKLRERIAEKETALRALENFGDGLHMIDYEQLRMENQSYGDKIEERDEELTRLRNKATSAIQILAHVREKSCATANNIEDIYERLKYVDLESSNMREYVGNMKRERNTMREEAEKLKHDLGLLVLPRLLRDFQKSIDESQNISAQIEDLKNNFNNQSIALSELRKTIYKAKKDGANTRMPSTVAQDLAVYRSLVAERRGDMPKKIRRKASLDIPDTARDKSVVRPIKKGRPSFFVGPRIEY